MTTPTTIMTKRRTRNLYIPKTTSSRSLPARRGRFRRHVLPSVTSLAPCCPQPWPYWVLQAAHRTKRAPHGPESARLHHPAPPYCVSEPSLNCRQSCAAYRIGRAAAPWVLVSALCAWGIAAHESSTSRADGRIGHWLFAAEV